MLVSSNSSSKDALEGIMVGYGCNQSRFEPHQDALDWWTLDVMLGDSASVSVIRTHEVGPCFSTDDAADAKALEEASPSGAGWVCPPSVLISSKFRTGSSLMAGLARIMCGNNLNLKSH